MINKVLSTIRKHNLIEYGNGIVVGLSGGPDSVCLLHVLKRLSERLGAKIFAVHVNHMLRGDEADADEEYSRELCRSLDIPFYSERCDVAGLAAKEGISVEEAGRLVRYSIFNKWVDRLGADKIAVAHNRNDQVETVLMNIFRGSGIDGLKGMDYSRGRVIRPLLDIDRIEIEDYCRNNDLRARTDKTNLESIYTRNKIRIELISYLRDNFNPSIMESILRLAENIREDAAFLNETAHEIYDSCRIDTSRDPNIVGHNSDRAKKKEPLIRLDAEKVAGMNRAMAGRVVRFAIRDVKGDLNGIESVHIRDVIKLCSGKTGSELHLPGNLRARLTYGKLEIFIAGMTDSLENQNFGEIAVMLEIPGITAVPEAGWSVETCILSPNDIEHYRNMRYNSLIQFFDYERLKEGIHLRNRRNGDVFKPLKGIGTMKLKKFLNERKIPRHERNMLPLIAVNSEIIWVVGHKISDKFKVTENTKAVLSIKFFNS